jgi:arylsulfatase A-like enzyme
MNVIYIKIDDFPKWMQYYIPTFMYFISKGMEFVNAKCTTDLCGPNRGISFTGRYAHVTGITDNDHAFENLVKWGRHRTVPAVIRPAYKTGKFGKSINGSNLEDNWDNMFDVWGITSKGEPDYFEVNENGRIRDIDRAKQSESEWIGKKAKSFIRNTSGPFFLDLTPHDPHGPYWVDDEYKGTFSEFKWRPSNYDVVSDSQPEEIRSLGPLTRAQVKEMDQNVKGKLRETMSVGAMLMDLYNFLVEVDRLKDTYIILDGDNGWQSGEHRLFMKGKPYEESLATPLVVVGGGISENSKEHALIGSVDIPTTVVDLAGADLPTDGRSLRPYLEGSIPLEQRNILYCEHLNQDWNLIIDDQYFKTVQRLDTGEVELYDLLDKPLEVNSLHKEAPEYTQTKVDKMNRMLELSGDELRNEELSYV